MPKKMSKSVKEMVELANQTLKFDSWEENQKLFDYVSAILLCKKMYHGFNYYVRDSRTGLLHYAPRDEEHTDEKGLFKPLPTDIRQFYIY